MLLRYGRTTSITSAIEAHTVRINSGAISYRSATLNSAVVLACNRNMELLKPTGDGRPPTVGVRSSRNMQSVVVGHRWFVIGRRSSVCGHFSVTAARSGVWTAGGIPGIG